MLLKPHRKNLDFIPAFFFFLPFLALAALSLSIFPVSAAEDIDSLREEIDKRNERIQNLEQEIQKYEQELVKVGAQKASLQGEIQRIDVTRKKVSTDINLTETQIDSTELQIEKLGTEIVDKERRIENGRTVIAKALRRLNELEGGSLIETILAHETMSEVWNEVTELAQYQSSVREDIEELRTLKEELTIKKLESEGKVEELADYRVELSGQKKVLDANRAEKDELLSVTKNQETAYQTLLEQKRAARAQIEREIQDFEAKIQFALDATKIPVAGVGVLKWPIAADYMASRCASIASQLGNPYCITQHFGHTAFAQNGAYGGKPHNGTDFGIPVGTPVHAPLAGTVKGVGNTDAVAGCLSYGRWIVVDHFNGLSTLYAHLSAVNVAMGQAVQTGDIIGFSGNTGYSTGPHLHFTVLATQGVQIVRFSDIKTSTSCGPALVPIAPTEAYLDPMKYLQ